MFGCWLGLNNNKYVMGRRVSVTPAYLRRTPLSNAEVAMLSLGHEMCSLLCMELQSKCRDSGHFTPHDYHSVPL